MKEHSFNQINKIKKSTDFQAAFKQGKVFKTLFFRVYVISRGLENSRLGICVSKKFAKASSRNRVKRVIRESFRKIKFPSPLDFVFVLTVDGIRLENFKLFHEVNEFFSKFIHNFSTDVYGYHSSTLTVLPKKDLPT